MSLPRYGSCAARGIIEKAFGALQIPIHTSQGVFWGQCMQRMMKDCVKDSIDFIITVDFDTLCTEKHINDLISTIAMNNHVDALAALEPKRNHETPLLWYGEDDEVSTDGSIFQVTHAHFGLTVIRTEALKEVEKPWFLGVPNENGDWDIDNN